MREQHRIPGTFHRVVAGQLPQSAINPPATGAVEPRLAFVNSLSQGTQTPLPGATMSFKLRNAQPGQANVPGPVTTQKDGRWSQSGFTVGFLYQAEISKQGVTFALATANFTKSTPGTVGDVSFIGTVK